MLYPMVVITEYSTCSLECGVELLQDVIQSKGKTMQKHQLLGGRYDGLEVDETFGYELEIQQVGSSPPLVYVYRKHETVPNRYVYIGKFQKQSKSKKRAK
jgi:hypothetical protein